MGYYGTETYFLDEAAPRPTVPAVNSDGQLTGGAVGNPTQIQPIPGVLAGWTVGVNSLFSGSGNTRVGLDSTGTTDDDVRIYAGSSTPSTAPFRVLESGALVASSATITGALTTALGSSIGTSYLSGLVSLANENIAAQGWTSTCIFSASDYRVVAWASGAITTAAGTAYSISAGNTGNMAATTYVYLDIAVSETVLQVTTTAATAIGAGKILIAVASPNTDTTSKAQYQVFGGIGGVRIFVDQLSANSASTNEFISNSAQLANLVVTNAKIGSLAVSKLTAGAITSKSIELAVDDGTGDTEMRAGIASGDFANVGAANGFIFGIDDSDSNKVKFYWGQPSAHFSYDGATTEFAGRMKTISSTTGGYFIGGLGDGMTETLVNGGTVTRGGFATKLSAGSDNDAAVIGCLLTADDNDGDTARFVDNLNMEFVVSLRLEVTADQDIFIGFHTSKTSSPEEDATSTTDHCGFFVQDGTLYASRANGTTQGKVDVSDGITLTNYNEYRVVLTGTTGAVFYINGTAVSSISTYLPDANSEPAFKIGILGQASQQGFVFVKHPFSIIKTN